MIRAGRAGAASLFACLCALSAPASALHLHADASRLSSAQAARSHALLDDATARLPPIWRAALGDVEVEWRDDLPVNVHGRALGNRILLRSALLDGNDARPGLAALVHELAHLYDRAGHRRLSRDARLRDLAGWADAPLRPWRTDNALTQRSPDPYELDSPAEYVAVNLEHFLLDADYACRRPALSRHFAQVFGTLPGNDACPQALPFLQATPDAASPLLLLDPARVYAVDYLLAEANERPMSRWGHSMLRLVVCAPGRAPGPECRQDLDQHLVLSFRAFVDDVQVSSWRGLTGDYASRLFVLPLAQVVDEYTKVELRGLQSIPLRLQPGEIAALLARAAQLHWSYDGRYRFIDNNCAVETARLLHDGIPRLSAARVMSLTPRGLLRRLQRAGLADASVLADRSEALRLGFYFEPASARYQAMYDIARDALALPPRRVEQWLALPPSARAAVFAHADLRASAALLLLEEAALRRRELEARDLLKHALSPSRRQSARAMLAMEDRLTRPASLLGGAGYGLPQSGELARLTGDVEGLARQWQARRRTFLVQAGDALPPAVRRVLEATETNVDALGTRLRQLNKALGGLELK